MHNKSVVWPLGQIRLLTERKARKCGAIYHIVKKHFTPLLCRTTYERVNSSHDERIAVSLNVNGDPVLSEFTDVFSGVWYLDGK